MLDHLDSMPVATVPSFLSALLAHSDFREGMHAGQSCFQEGLFWDDHEKTWTEDEIIEFVSEELSVELYRREQCIETVMGPPSLSYLHHLGFTISYLDQALAAKGQ
jgi:hypothetical protein